MPRVPSASRSWLPALLAATLAAATAVGQTTNAAPAPVWNRPALSSILATNIAEDAAPELSPYEAALRMLDEPSIPGTNAPTPGDFSASSIMKLEPDRGEDARDPEEEVEEENARSLLREANDISRKGDLDGAIRLLMSVLPEIRRAHVRASLYGRIGHFYFRKNQLEDAEEYMRLAVDNRPYDPRLSSNLAAVLLTLGRLDDAEEMLRGINLELEFDPNLLFVVHFNLACIESLRGNVETGIKHLGAAAATEPFQTLASLGDPHIDALRSHPDFPLIAAALEQVVREQPQNEDQTATP